MSRKVLIAVGIGGAVLLGAALLFRSRQSAKAGLEPVLKAPTRNVFSWNIGQGSQPPVAPTMTRPGPPGGFSGQAGQAAQALQTGVGAAETVLQAGRDFVNAFRN